MKTPQARWIPRERRWLAVALLISLACVGLTLLRAAGQTPPRTSVSVLVKVRAPFVTSIEAALPLEEMELLAGQTGNTQVDEFMAGHGVRKIVPLYPKLVKIKKQSGQSDLEIATGIRRRFTRRANRLRAEFHPPEISRTYVLELGSPSGSSMAQTLDDFKADANVEFAEENKVVSLNFTPNDPYFLSYGSWGQAYDDLWGIKKIGAPTAWDTTAGAGIIVAVVDTGIDYNHPDIASNIWINTGEIPNNGIDDDGNGYIDDVRGWDFIGSSYQHPTQSNNPIDHFGHGTHVAGTIAAVGNNGIGVIGVAWKAQVMAVKGLDDNGNGIDSTLSNALIYAANNGADVISNSWAGQGTSQTIADAVSYAYNLGAVAGTSMGTPVDANYTRADGTSMATPHVSGLAALVLSQYPTYSNEDVRQVIRVSATSFGTPGFDLNYGYGRINATAAISVPDAVEAKILSPIDGAHIYGPVTISGVARGSAFAQYKLEYGSGQSPTAWTLIQSGTGQVAGGTLGVFDPSTVPDGFYVIRLTAYDLSNNAFTDRIELAVNYLSIVSPTPPAVPVVASVFKPGAQVSITGTATGASFQDFRIDWAEGIKPSAGWSNVGISLSGGGASPITSGPLGTWDTTALSKADYYTIRLSVDDAGFTSTAFTLIYLEPSLLSQNWPIALDEGTYWSSGIVPATDALGNQKLTLVSPGATVTSEFKTFSPDGATQTNTPLTYYGSLFQPATGDLDGNPGDEAAMTDVLMLRVFRGDNTSYTLTPAQTMELSNSQVVLEDLNNDSQLEIVAFGEDYNVKNAYVYAYLRNGQLLNANFPITIANQNSNIDTYTKGNRLLVGDIDGDGNREILVLEGTTASTFTPRLFANDGTPKAWAAAAFNGYPDQMVLADLDHNGKLETIFTCSCNSRKELHVLQPDGSERTGWPAILGTYPYYMTYIAIGDLNRDGREEIVVSNSNELVVLEDNGTPFSSSWPIVGTGYTSFGPVVLADINGDGLPEILTSEDAVSTAPNPLLASATAQSTSAVETVRPQVSTGIEVDANGNRIMRPRVDVTTQVTSQNIYFAPQIVAFRSDASVVRSWNMPGAKGNQPFYTAKLTVGDFNKDGLTDIAVTYWTIEGGGMSGWLKEGVATVLTTGTPYNPSANDWPMIYQNPRNTAGLIRDVTPPTVAITFPTSGATVAGSVMVTANAADNVGVIGVQFQLDGTNLGAEATTAPWHVTWDTSTASLGSHTLTATARDAAGNRTTSAPVSVTVTPPPSFVISPTSLSFGAQQINTTSSTQSVTFANNGQVSFSVSSVTSSGDFSQTNNCVTTFAPGASCTINVTFTPTVRGPETGTLSISGSFSAMAQTVSLSGTGQALLSSLAPSSLTFPGQQIGTSSPAQTVTYTNTGDLALSIAGITTTGDFAQTNNCGSSLAPSVSCVINVTFTPTASGARSGVVNVSSNSNPAVSSASLTGTGIAPVASFSPSSLTYSAQPIGTSSAAQSVSLSNTGGAPLTITGFSTTGDFSQTNNCGTSLAAGASCSISVTFTPTVRGTESGTLSVNGSSSASIPLSGTGALVAVTFSPTTLNFGNQPVSTTSAPQNIAITNTGDVSFYLNGWSNPGVYPLTNNCPFTLNAGASCTFTVTFAPTSAGTFNYNLTISGSFPNSPETIAVNGTGTAAVGTLLPSSQAFGNQQVGTTSAVKAVDLINTGNVPLGITSIQVTGDFAQTNNCGSSLAPSYSCVISVTFTPTASGTRNGLVNVSSNSTPAVSSANLTGTGMAPVASFSASSLSYTAQRVGTSSAAQSVTLSNPGGTALTISGFSVTGDFSQTNNCGSSLAAGANCSASVTFTPTARGSRAGVLTLNSNTSGTTPTVSLMGTGTAPVASISSASLAFGNQSVNTTSAPSSVTLTNTGDATLNISGISTSGDFSQTNNCASTLAGGASCSVSVTFKPTATGNRTGMVTIADDAFGGSPQTVSLSGAGISPKGAFSPSSLTFASQLVNTSSTSQTLTLTSTGVGPLSISGFTLTGDFSQSNNCGATLVAGASCSVYIVFTPTARGNRTGTLTLNSNAVGSTPSANLTGTGVAPVASLSATSLSFSSQLVNTTSGSKSVTLNNSGDVSLSISGISVNGDFAQTNNCPTSLAKGANCKINVSFTPAVSGSRTGVLSITDDALGGSPQTVSLSGTGVDYSVAASPTSVTLAAGQSATITVSVSALGGNYNQSVSLSCSGLPAASSCDFSPNSGTPNSGSVNSALKVSTTARQGSNGTPAGSYTVTITGTAHSTQHSTTVQLTVN